MATPGLAAAIMQKRVGNGDDESTSLRRDVARDIIKALRDENEDDLIDAFDALRDLDEATRDDDDDDDDDEMTIPLS